MKIPHVVNELLDDPEVGKARPDAIALLLLYQKHSQVKNKMRVSAVKVDDAYELLSISTHRIRKARKVLYKKGYIADHSEPNSLGSLDHYIKLHVDKN